MLGHTCDEDISRMASLRQSSKALNRKDQAEAAPNAAMANPGMQKVSDPMLISWIRTATRFRKQQHLQSATYAGRSCAELRHLDQGTGVDRSMGFS